MRLKEDNLLVHVEKVEERKIEVRRCDKPLLSLQPHVRGGINSDYAFRQG